MVPLVLDEVLVILSLFIYLLMVPLASSNQLVQDQGSRVLEKVLVQTNNRVEVVPQNLSEILLFSASEVLMRF